MKNWLVKVELYWSSNCVETLNIKANTERKAREFAKEKCKKEYKDIGNMINILSCSQINPSET